MSQPAFWEREDWNELPYSVKLAEMNTFLQQSGYDPVEAQHDDEHRRLKEQVAQLQHRVEQLELELRRWIESEAAARQARIDGYREQRY